MGNISFVFSAIFFALFALFAQFVEGFGYWINGGDVGDGFVVFGTIANFIPQVWSARLLAEFRRARRWRRAITDVSDEIARQGDTIHVGEITSNVTVKNYDKDIDIDPPELQDDSEQNFEINQGKYFNIGVNDVDRVQSQPALLPRFTSEAAYQLALNYDRYIFGLYRGSGVASFEATAPTAKAKPTAAANSIRLQRLVIAGILNSGRGAYSDEAAYTTACEEFANDLFFLQRILLDKDWPLANEDTGGEGGEGAGPEAYALVNTKSYEAINWYLLQNGIGTGQLQDAAIRSGLMRQFFGFNLVPDRGMDNADAAADSVGKIQVALGLPAGIYSAEQIRQTEAYRPEKRFQDAVKGLSVYGGKRVDATKLFAVVQAKGTAVGKNDVNGDG